MRVLSVVHTPLARAEVFGDAVDDGGHQLIEWEIRRDERLPAWQPLGYRLASAFLRSAQRTTSHRKAVRR